MSLFVALDGPDGCGKSTQARMLATAFRERGDQVVHLREPGSTPFGERIRAALLDHGSGDVDALAEALAFSAARRAMLEQEVAPARRRGAIVVAERCFASTVVYQCRAPLDPGARAPEELVRDVTRAVHRDHPHDLIVVLDVDAATAARRARSSGAPDRIEGKGAAFHERVRAGFVDLAGERSWVHELLRRDGSAGRIAVVDASRPVEEVHAAVLALALSERRRP